MNLLKAIEIGKDILRCIKPGDPPEEHEALSLLIEAGKRIQTHREHSIPGPMFLLPGETID